MSLKYNNLYQLNQTYLKFLDYKYKVTCYIEGTAYCTRFDKGTFDSLCYK